MQTQYYTYLYIDPKHKQPIYVGKGSGDRAWSHFHESHNPYLHRIINRRRREGYMVVPIINIMATEELAFAREKAMISYYGRKDLGTGTLLNKSEGGDSPPSRKGVKLTDEQTKRLSMRLKGIPKSEEGKRNMKAAQEIRVLSDDALARISAANKGKPKSAAHKEKLAAAIKGKPSAIKGIPKSEEHKAKLAESLREHNRKRKELLVK